MIREVQNPRGCILNESSEVPVVGVHKVNWKLIVTLESEVRLDHVQVGVLWRPVLGTLFENF